MSTLLELPPFSTPADRSFVRKLLDFLGLSRTPAEIAAGITHTTCQYPELCVLRYMSAAQIADVIAGNRTLDVTAAFHAARDVALAYEGVVSGGNGAEIYVPKGTYAVTELNFSTATTNFERALVLRGDGHTNTAIVPFAAGKVLLNLKGTNQFTVRDLTIDSRSVVSQYGVYICRTTTSDSCNNNQFINFRTIGSYSVTSFASFSAESTNFQNCKLENSNAAALYKTFITGPRPSDFAAPNTVNGGTATTGPNTDNCASDCEFYSPYAGAEIIELSEAAGYCFLRCTIIGYNSGGAGNAKGVVYSHPVTGVWLGPVIWIAPHIEMFGTGISIHYMSGTGSVTYNGISSYGGHYVVTTDTALLDFDRTSIANQPILQASTWTTPGVPPGVTGTAMYAYGFYSCTITLKPENSNGVGAAFGLLVNSKIDITDFRSPSTITLGRQETYGTATPTAGTYCQGHVHHATNAALATPTGFICTGSGTVGSLAGGAAVGSINSGTNQLNVSSASGHYVGAQITIAGVAGVKTVRKIVGTLLYLDSNANASVTGVAIAFSPATFVSLAPAYFLEGSATIDLPNLAAGVNSAIQTITVTGAALGDHVYDVSCSIDTQGICIWPWVSAANTVSFVGGNRTPGAIDLASAIFTARVGKKI